MYQITAKILSQAAPTKNDKERKTNKQKKWRRIKNKSNTKTQKKDTKGLKKQNTKEP